MCVFGPSGLSGGAFQARPGGEAGDGEADRLQRRLEQSVLLETIAAASAADELGLDRGQFEADRTAQERVQSLERNRGDMGGVQRGERRQIGRKRAGVTDARKISAEIEIRHASPRRWADLQRPPGPSSPCRSTLASPRRLAERGPQRYYPPCTATVIGNLNPRHGRQHRSRGHRHRAHAHLRRYPRLGRHRMIPGVIPVLCPGETFASHFNLSGAE